MKSTLIATLSGFLLPALLVMVMNLIGDPYQYYRPNPAAAANLSENERWQHAGLIKHYDYDTLIVGTSRSQNFTPEMFEAGNWKALKATMAGSTAWEQLTVADFALNLNTVERVVLELSFSSYTQAAAGRHEFPDFLYRPRFETPFLYLLSWDMLQRQLDIRADVAHSRPLAELNVWQHNLAYKFGADRVREFLSQRCEAEPVHRDPKYLTANLSKLQALVSANPDVTFVGYLPPLPAIHIAISAPSVSRARFAFRAELAHLDASYTNLSVFDYATAGHIVLDLDRYKDPEHYDMNANREIALGLATGRAPQLDLLNPNSQLRALGLEAIAELPDGCDRKTAVSQLTEFNEPLLHTAGPNM